MNKEEWVINYIKEHGTVDHLNAEFVDEYIDTFNPKFTIQPYGAHTCKDLNRLLSKMHKDGLLKRGIIGLKGTWGMGFPKWVYVYELNNNFK